MKPAADQDVTADTVEPWGNGAHVSSKGALGPTVESQDPQTSQFISSGQYCQKQENWNMSKHEPM